MAKNKAVSTELVAEKTSAALASGAQTLGLSPAEQLRHLEEQLGVSAAEVEVIAAGTLPFWPAMPGAVLVGEIQGRREVKTQHGTVGLYTVRVTKPCIAATLDGEVFELVAGDNISLLERELMKELQGRIGQTVAVLNMGKRQGKEFAYWDYKIVGKKRTAEQIQAGSQQLMASLQSKQLSQAAE